MSSLETASREDLLVVITALQGQVALLQAEVERLKGQKPGAKASVPSFVKANRPEREKMERKKRTQSYVRTRQTPTEVRVHAMETCPDCGRGLSGGWVHRLREVIEIPSTPVVITEHRILARRCGVCGVRCLPSVDLSQEVVGQHRVGARLMSLIGWLSAVGRVPLRRIQALLLAVYGVRLSLGELSEVLHAVAAKGKPAYEELGRAVQSSPYVHADETGWRQDGVNGYVWIFTTPAIRYFVYDKSRSHEVPQSVLGLEYEGILVSDFYSGYHFHQGRHQRCWVHFLRDLHALREDHPEESSVTVFVDSVVALYRKAKAWVQEKAGEPGNAECLDNRYRAERVRANARDAFQEEAMALARPFLGQEVSQRVLAQRIEKFLPELFAFVEYPDVPSENNAAERAIRPCVITRKVSGGTRSKKGSNTKMVLMSLFGTWNAQGQNLLHTCQLMLAAPATTPAV